ncbi:BnaC03g30260D [Brassica napus]|uniref:BnaC03g30260D protein n=1 Tax=Brassica napus TaxID=3708 RepID=A0A078FXR2_BRANA|nr:BnaC03g30260D [Brassica napus]
MRFWLLKKPWRIPLTVTLTFCLWRYTPAIDIWSIGCIFAEVLTWKPLFPGKSVAHQLELITDLLGTLKSETISGVRNDNARKYLNFCSGCWLLIQRIDPLLQRLLLILTLRVSLRLNENYRVSQPRRWSLNLKEEG